MRGPSSPPPGCTRVRAGHRGPGAPPSFLLQPRSPSPSRPCSLGAGMSPEAQSSPPSGCHPGPPRTPEADRGPPSGRPASHSQHAHGASVHGGCRGPPHPARTSFSTGRPCARLLWLWCRRAAGAWDPGWAVSAPRGRGVPALPGSGSHVSSSFLAAPASTGQAPESPDPCTKGSTKRRVNTTETTHPGGIIAKDHEDV